MLAHSHSHTESPVVKWRDPDTIRANHHYSESLNARRVRWTQLRSKPCCQRLIVECEPKRKESTNEKINLLNTCTSYRNILSILLPTQSFLKQTRKNVTSDRSLGSVCEQFCECQRIQSKQNFQVISSLRLSVWCLFAHTLVFRMYFFFDFFIRLRLNRVCDRLLLFIYLLFRWSRRVSQQSRIAHLFIFMRFEVINTFRTLDASER